MASTPYCEQVGVNLQFAPNIGEMAYWYTFIKPKKNQPNSLLMNFIGLD